MSPSTQSAAVTRDRLLHAAGEVFAEHGFRNATIRQICKRAGANIAAVNYHFQSKEQLYASVLKFAYTWSLEHFPPTSGLGEGASARDRLHAFVRAFLLRIFNEGEIAWFGKLMAREMVDPTNALDELVNQTIRPQNEMLSGIVREILGADADELIIGRCVTSIVGQCVFQHNCRPVLARLYGKSGVVIDSIEQVDAVAAHITEFSFVAMVNLKAESAGRRGQSAASMKGPGRNGA